MTLQVTRTGKAVARSGLHPHAVVQILGFLGRNLEPLRTLLLRNDEDEFVSEDDFEFVALHTIFGSAEFDNRVTYRFLPYQFLDQALTGPQAKLQRYLDSSAEVNVTNAAVLAYRWIQGVDIGSLESALGVRSGVLTALFAEAASIFRGLADIIYAASSQRPNNVLPSALTAEQAARITLFVAPFRALARRLVKGLPDELLWMTDLEANGSRLLGRREIIAIRDQGLTTPDEVIDPGRKNEVLQALGTVSERNKAKANDLVEAVRVFKGAARQRLKDSQIRRLPECEQIIESYYASRDKAFEDQVDILWNWLGLPVAARDDDSKSAFPDFILDLDGGKKWSVECKSKQGMGYVALTDATAVISKASTHGFHLSFKITVCQPFVSTDVPRKLAQCEELCVVNAEDLIEGAVRAKLGKISKDAFVDWLSRPGQAQREFLATAE